MCWLWRSRQKLKQERARLQVKHLSEGIRPGRTLSETEKESLQRQGKKRAAKNAAFRRFAQRYPQEEVLSKRQRQVRHSREVNKITMANARCALAQVWERK